MWKKLCPENYILCQYFKWKGSVFSLNVYKRFFFYFQNWRRVFSVLKTFLPGCATGTTYVLFVFQSRLIFVVVVVVFRTHLGLFVLRNFWWFCRIFGDDRWLIRFNLSRLFIDRYRFRYLPVAADIVMILSTLAWYYHNIISIRDLIIVN